MLLIRLDNLSTHPGSIEEHVQQQARENEWNQDIQTLGS